MTTPTQYEFTTDQNTTIGKLSKSMSELGGFMLVIGVLYLIGTLVVTARAFRQTELIPAAVIAMATTVFYLLIGNWTRTAAGSFRKVVDTSGNDVDHLMTALDRLQKLYYLMVTVIKVMLVIVIVGVLAAVMIPSMMR